MITGPRPAAERSDAVANRARLVEAAREVFGERGLSAEMREIAERAGVGVGTIYRNFPGKEDLVIAILKDAVATALVETREAERLADPLEGLRRLVERELSLLRRYGWLFEALVSGQVPPRCQAEVRLDLERERFFSRYDRLVERAVAAGTLRSDIDARAAAALIAGGVSAAGHRSAEGPDGAEALAEALVAIFLEGAGRRDG